VRAAKGEEVSRHPSFPPLWVRVTPTGERTGDGCREVQPSAHPIFERGGVTSADRHAPRSAPRSRRIQATTYKISRPHVLHCELTKPRKIFRCRLHPSFPQDEGHERSLIARNRPSDFGRVAHASPLVWGRTASVSPGQHGAQVMEAIQDAAQAVSSETRRPVILVLRVGVEGTSPLDSREVRERLQRSGAMLYVISTAGAARQPQPSARTGISAEQAQLQDDEIAASRTLPRCSAMAPGNRAAATTRSSRPPA
jgi:hypothetical protein